MLQLYPRRAPRHHEGLHATGFEVYPKIIWSDTNTTCAGPDPETRDLALGYQRVDGAARAAEKIRGFADCQQANIVNRVTGQTCCGGSALRQIALLPGVARFLISNLR